MYEVCAMEGVWGFFFQGFEILYCEPCHSMPAVIENQAEKCEQHGLFRCVAL